MHKIFTFLAVLGCMLCANITNAQTTFSVTPAEEEANISIGDTVTVHITVTNFVDIATFQFSVNWTSADLEYLSVGNIGLPNYGAGDFGPGTPVSFLTTSWTAPMTNPYTSPDTCIFSIDFEVLTMAGITGDILITSMPTTIEVIGLNEMGMLDDITSTVTFNNGTATIPSVGSGPSCNFGGQFGQSLDSAEVATGNQVCLSVYACAFTDIVSAQYSINWDPADLQFTAAGSFNLASLDASAFNHNNAQGWMTFSWLDSLGAGVTVPDLTPIYDICFTAIGSGGTIDTVSFTNFPLSIEVTDAASMGSPIPFNSEPGLVTITGNSSSAVTVSGTCEQGGPNDQVCIQMTTQNFDSIVGMQYTMHWDTSVLEYASVGNFAPFLTIGEFNQLNDTTLIFQWFDFGNVPRSLMNGDTLYEICFDIVGDIGETGSFYIDGNPIIIEATQRVNGSDIIVPLITQTCDVEVVGVSNDLNIFASTEEGCPSPADTVYIAYTTTGFIGIASMQFDITIDTSVLEFLGSTNISPNLPGAHNFVPQTNGDIRYSWFEPNTNALTLTNGDTLFQLCFLVTGADGTSSDISYDYAGTIEITDGSNLITNYTLHDGSVSVTNNACDGGLSLTAALTHVDCNGNSTGAIDLSVTGGTPGYTYLWTPGGGTSQDTSGLLAGTYTVVVTDMDATTSTQSFTINEPVVLAATISSTDISCNGLTDGSATANPTGGSLPYAYLWTSGATTQTDTNLAAGMACVTVTDDSLCVVTACVTITEPTAITATMSSTPSNCTTDTGTVGVDTPSGGSGSGYTYLWDGGATTQTLSGVPAGNYCVTITDSDGCTGVECEMVPSVAGMTLGFIITDASCSTSPSGIVTAQPANGSGTYTYLWSANAGNATTQDISGLLPDDYTVTVTDSGTGCSITGTATVGAGPGASVSAAATDVSCIGAMDGTATATPISGAGSYTYVWSGGAGTTQTIAGLAAGSYTVTMTDAAGCTDSATATVGSPDAVNPSAFVDSGYNGEDISCNGGSDGAVDVSTTGGTGAYSYEWSTGDMTQEVTGLPQGTYTVTVTDANGCTGEDDVFLDDPEPISLSAVITDEDTGSDGAVDLSDTGGTGGLSYLWSANAGNATTQDISGLMAGDYCVTVTDGNSCTMTGCYTVNPPNALDVTLVSTTPESCYNEMDGAIEISSTGVGPFTYVWDPALSDTNNPTNVGQGTYSVTVTDTSSGIQGVESGILVGGPTEAINVSLVSTMDVTCNGGSDGCITVSVTGGNGGAYNIDWGSAGVGSNICGLSVGTYTPTVTDNNGCTAIGNLIAIDQPTPIVITVDNVVMPGCGGALDGEVHITPSGGNGPYTVSWFVDGSPVAGNTTSDLTGLGEGEVTGQVTDANGCVESFGPITLVQVGSPEVTLVAVIDVSCAGDNSGAIDVTVTGGLEPYAPYVWTNSLDVNVGGSEDLVGVPGDTYTLVVTDQNGCTGTSGPIVLNEPTAITITTNTITPASSDNDDGVITMNPPSGGVPGYTYSWTNSGNVVIGTTLDIAGLAMDIYTLVVTDANSCTEEITVVVEGSFTIPPSQVIVTDVTCAGGNNGAIDITIFGGTEPYEYLWNTTPSQITQDLANITAGEYCVTVEDATGLLAFGCWTVDAPDQLTIQTVDVTHETGNGCNGSIDLTVTGGTIPYTFSWSNGSTVPNPENLCKGAYFVTITDANGCIITNSTAIDVFPPPITIEDPIITNELCENSCDGAIKLDVFGGCGPYTFSLTGPTNLTTNDLDGIDVVLGDLCPGSYVLSVSDADLSTNTPDVPFSFTILPADPIVVTEDNIIHNTGGPDCNGAINISAVGGTGVYTYQWSNGDTSEDIDNLCNDLSPYSVTVTDGNDCTGVLSGLEVNDAPYVSEFEVSNVTCFGDTDGVIDIINVEFGTEPYMYSWSSGEGTQDLNNKGAGSYIVTITDALGTTSVASFNISGPSVALSAMENSITHPTGDNPDGAINIDVSGGWGSYTYMWSNGSTSMDLGGLLEGFYTVTVTDAGGCEEILGPIELIAERLFLDSFTEEDVDCKGAANGFVCVDVDGGVGPYSYNWSNGISGEDCIYNLEPDTYTLMVTDANGLTKEFPFEITEPDSIQISFTTDPSTATATAIGGTTPYDYTWNTNPQTIGPVVVDQPTGDYSVVVTDANGCTAFGTVQITEVLGGDCDEVRTILSPNGDNKNETFEILCARVHSVRLEVFNRWGQLVYEADNYDNTWAARDASGNPLQEGGYFYVITYNDVDGKERQAKGHVTIIK